MASPFYAREPLRYGAVYVALAVMFESDDVAWRGAVLSTENARALYESASHIQDSGHFGCAAALFVLCAEEASKAMAIGFNISNPIPEKNLRDLFRAHSLKHDGGAHLSTIAHLLIGIMQEAPEEGKPYTENVGW